MSRLSKILLSVAGMAAMLAGCERAPDSNSAATSQSTSERLREAARSVKDEAKETARAVKEEALQVGEQVRQAAHEVKEQARESAAVMKGEAGRAWAATRDDALRFSATALDKTRETLAALREKAAEASETARPMIDTAIAEIEKQARTIGEKVETLKATTPETWQKTSEEMAPAIEKLQSAADAAARQFGVSGSAAAGAPKGNRTITGTIGYRERMALPAGADVAVKLVDVSKADAPAVMIAEKTFKLEGQVPFAFELGYDGAKIDASATYAIEAVISVDGKPVFRTMEAYHVITSGNPTKVDLVLKRTGE